MEGVLEGLPLAVVGRPLGGLSYLLSLARCERGAFEAYFPVPCLVVVAQRVVGGEADLALEVL